MPVLALVTAAVPDPRREGAAFRLLQLMQLCLAQGLSVRIVPLQAEFASVSAETLQERHTYWKQQGIEVMNALESSREHFEAAGHSYAVYWYDSYIAASLAMPELKARFPQACHVFDTVDLAHRRYFREAKLFDNKKLLLKAIKTKQLEYELADLASVTIAISEDEALALGTDLPNARITYFPNIHALKHDTSLFDSRMGVVFIGNYDHRPNVDAVEWLCRDIWPICLELDPNLELNLVGAGSLDSVNIPKQMNIHTIGYVEDLDAYLDRPRLTIAPLRYGAGIKGKVLLSMSQGVPCVLSSMGAEGIPLSKRQSEDLIHDEARDIARAVVRLHNDAVFWALHRDLGYSLIEANYSMAISQGRMSAFFKEYLQGRLR